MTMRGALSSAVAGAHAVGLALVQRQHGLALPELHIGGQAVGQAAHQGGGLHKDVVVRVVAVAVVRGAQLLLQGIAPQLGIGDAPVLVLLERAFEAGGTIGRGGRVVTDIRNDLPMPRNAQVQLSPRYNELKGQIWETVQSEVMRSLQATRH